MEFRKPSVLINFGPLKAGGGQNVALNFIMALSERKELPFTPFFTVSEKSQLHRELEESKWKYNLVIVSGNPLVRMLQELTNVTSFIVKNSIDVVYSYFGFGIYLKSVKQIVGSADSNLYFPEVDFWKDEKGFARVKRALVDKYRIFGLRIASGVIYENEAMCDRADELYGIDNKVLILPSIAVSNRNESVDFQLEAGKIRVLLLCGWQKNKNILIIPQLAATLRKQYKNIEFVITTSDDGSSCAREFFDLVDKHQVQDIVKCIGVVKKSQLTSLYSQCDYLFLLSKLESFSNNIIEAWQFDVPLVISNEEWSKSICGDAAYYVDRDDINEIARGILELETDIEKKQRLIYNGKNRLDMFPTVEQRLEQEIKYIESFIE
ncbi:glycosyltransferase [Enterovibrio makurazakiensis]|uniref:glycosyltransferase n=1 Tax=Enterovibrio makurazakiensis TaxID=2910232 RepID=UPI003D19D9D7